MCKVGSRLLDMPRKKQWLAILVIMFFGVVAMGGGCGWAATRVARQIFNFQFSIFNREYKTFRWCTNGLPFVDRLEQLLGGKYIILLQNNTELRPSGGFAGSYATIETDKKGIKQIRVQDIYEPDGKLPGHVDPPYPIQEAFGQGWWKLRDANWDPDYASAAGAMRWFLEQGGEGNIQGIIAVNLGLVNRLMGIYGPLELETYDELITEANFYGLAQKYAETRKIDNSTDKRGFLGAVGVAIEERIKASKLIDLIDLSALIFRELRKGEILVWVRNPEVQKEIEFRKWGGRLTANWDPSAGSGRADYLYIVESNLGANKANCCIDRDVSVSVSPPSPKASEGQVTRHEIIVTWKNNNEFENPKPPVFWGGDYIDYVRVIVPKDKKIVSVSVSGKQLRLATEQDFIQSNALRQGRSENIYVVEERGDPSASSGRGLKIIGFWAVVPAQQQVVAELEYKSERVEEFKTLLFKHQPGSGVTNYQVLVDGVIKVVGQLDRDKEIVIE